MKSLFGIATLAAVAVTASTNAAVIDNTVITDVTGIANTPSFQVENLLGDTITGDESVYLVGTLNAQAPFTGATNWFEAGFMTTGNVRTTSVGLVGNEDLGIIRNGGGKISAATNLVAGTPTTFVLKVNLVTGDQWLWLDPVFGAVEDTGSADATAGAAHSAGGGTGAALAGASIDTVFFRSGTWGGNTNTYDYTDFAVYYDGDTPFVPEPTSLALLGLGGLLVARRRRA